MRICIYKMLHGLFRLHCTNLCKIQYLWCNEEFKRNIFLFFRNKFELFYCPFSVAQLSIVLMRWKSISKFSGRYSRWFPYIPELIWTFRRESFPVFTVLICNTNILKSGQAENCIMLKFLTVNPHVDGAI